jgi:hypothetical protein
MSTKLIYTWKRRVNRLNMDSCIPKTKKIRFSLDTPKIGRVFLAGDSNGCVSVVPEAFEMREHIMLYQARFPEYQL